jgi:mono/diheme cytochrome c family protein
MRNRTKPAKRHAKPFLVFVAVLVAASALPGPAPAQSNPATDADSVEKGKRVFERSNCAGCHPGGTNSLNPTKPIKGQKFQSRYKDDSILEQVIRHGFLSAGMPPFPKSVISEKEMKDLIAYVRSLTPKEPEKPEANHKVGT